MIESLEDLTPDPKNANRGTERGDWQLGESLQRYGAGRSIVTDKNGVIIAGNGVHEVATEAGLGAKVVHTTGEDLVVVVRDDLDLATDKRARELALVDNKVGQARLEWDAGVLLAQLPDLDLNAFWSPEELAALTGDSLKGQPDPDDVPEVTEDPITKRGDIIRLGNHRLMCGDATSETDVQRLLDGVKPFLCVTDPPWGVNYDPAWRNRAAAEGKLAYGPTRIGRVTNDDRADWHEAWELFPGDVIYCWHPGGVTSLVHAKALQDSGFNLRMQIIWAKSNFAIGRGDYHLQHEPCWYGVRDGKPSRRNDDRTQTTLWEIDLDRNVEGGHSTQKPVECMARPIRNHEPCDVYDPFCGSGTTVIACEELNRTCYAMEIDLHYCDVIVQRWENFTGRCAQRPDRAAASDTRVA